MKMQHADAQIIYISIYTYTLETNLKTAKMQTNEETSDHDGNATKR